MKIGLKWLPGRRYILKNRAQDFSIINKELIILSTGKCSGKIICKNLVVEAGGFLSARVTCLVAEDSNIEIGDIK